MTSVVEVRLWDTRIGAAALEDGVAAFQYDEAFLRSGVEIAPLTMPLSRQVYRFPELPRGSFHGLPGLLADSLPDRFGNALIDAWLARDGRDAADFNAVERLCYTGKRGMGALEFRPAIGPEASASQRLEVDKLVALASAILSQREDLAVSLSEESADGTDAAMRQILRVGTSAGGARAKAVIAWNPATNEVRSGQVKAPAGHEYWLLKFDGIKSNRDKELNDPADYGTVEYAYHLMARAAGIAMTDCRLLIENGRRHFMTRRFDRRTDGEKIHMQSLAALAHFDFNAAGAYAYEQAFGVARDLGQTMDTTEELFRRAVFNILARNQDDHAKNISFLMDRSGRWSLAPAYDLSYSYNPSGLWTKNHQMSLNGKRDNFARPDFTAAAKTAGLKRGADGRVISEVGAAVARWPEFAEAAGVTGERIQLIGGQLRLNLATR